jgi:RimJ/RimL family protein N-acetyltransferase
LAQPAVYQDTSWNLTSADCLQPLFDSYESKDLESQIRFAVIANADQRLVGTFGFHTISRANRTAELAFDLCPSVWGQGIAQSLCETAVQWAFERLEFVRVQAVVLETNVRSANTLERSGFQREGYLRHYRQVRGQPGNFWMFSKTACPGLPLAFRRATSADIAAMSRIRLAVRENTLSDPSRIPLDMYETYLERSGCGWVAEHRGEIIAFCYANKVNASIWALFVHPDHEGRGLGKRLLRLAVDWLFERGHDRIHLTTGANTRADRFYARQGWVRKPVSASEIAYSLSKPHMLE